MTKPIKLGPPAPTRWSLVRQVGDVVLDLVMGMETSGDVGYDKLGFDASRGLFYRATDWFTLLIVWRMLNSLDLSPEDAFVDFGSGKGRMLFLAARYSFKEVIGVEISRALNEIARLNLINRGKSAFLRKIKLFNYDAIDYIIPDNVRVIYLNNPFQGQVFLKVMHNVKESLRRRPRRIEIIYAFPVMHQALLDRGFRVVGQGAVPSFRTPAPRTVLMYSNT